MPRFRLTSLYLVALSHAFGQTGSTLVGAGYGPPPVASIAPGQVLTLWVTGLKVISESPVSAATLPLPTELSGISVSLTQNDNRAFSASFPVPLLSIEQTNGCSDSLAIPECIVTGITVQIPFELIVDPFTSPPFTQLAVSQDRVAGRSFGVSNVQDNIHVLTTCGDGFSQACATHADGTLVSIASPAKPGEIVTIYAVGLGRSTPAAQTGQVTPIPAPVVPGINVNFDFRPNAGPTRPALLETNPPGFLGVSPVFAGLTPGQVGLYQINVRLPENFPAVPPCGNSGFHAVLSNLTINIGSFFFSFDGAQICVQPTR